VIDAVSREDVGIVVGVDETTGCESALAYAFEQAKKGRQMLRAVHAWQTTQHSMCSDREAIERSMTTDRLEVWRPQYPEVTVVADIRHGHPVDVLVEAAIGAEMLVVGARGHATASGALGSVSGGVLYRASCPVVVVRCPKQGRDND
jgi:nucleotide-binding universal stress UspA family protein